MARNIKRRLEFPAMVTPPLGNVKDGDDLKKLLTSSIFERPGKWYVTKDFIMERPDVLFELQKRIVITGCTFIEDIQLFEYVGFSWSFDKADMTLAQRNPSDFPPEYTMIVNQEGRNKESFTIEIKRFR